MTITASATTFLGWLFLRSAVHKFSNRSAFAAIAESYRLAKFLPFFPWPLIIPILESALAILLLASSIPSLPAIVGQSLSLAFILVGLIEILLRRLGGESRFACGCGGDFQHDDDAIGMMSRNSALAIVIVLLMMYPTAPTLLDYPFGLAMLLAFDLLSAAIVSEGRIQAWRADG